VASAVDEVGESVTDVAVYDRVFGFSVDDEMQPKAVSDRSWPTSPVTTPCPPPMFPQHMPGRLA
jgi:hypothetical protein